MLLKPKKLHKSRLFRLLNQEVNQVLNQVLNQAINQGGETDFNQHNFINVKICFLMEKSMLLKLEKPHKSRFFIILGLTTSVRFSSEVVSPISTTSKCGIVFVIFVSKVII